VEIRRGRVYRDGAARPGIEELVLDSPHSTTNVEQCEIRDPGSLECRNEQASGCGRPMGTVGFQIPFGRSLVEYLINTPTVRTGHGWSPYVHSTYVSITYLIGVPKTAMLGPDGAGFDVMMGVVDAAQFYDRDGTITESDYQY
jgi:hypothetical protein